MGSSIENTKDINLDHFFSLGQVIDWLTGYRLGKYPFIGRSNRLYIDEALDCLSDQNGFKPEIEVSKVGATIPLYRFYSPETIKDITKDELISLYGFSKNYTSPVFNPSYATKFDWQSKPFVSGFPAEDVPKRWKGLRPDPYKSVADGGDGPQMPLGVLKAPDQSKLVVKPGSRYLSNAEIIDVSEGNNGGESFQTWIWRGPSSRPPISKPTKITSKFKVTASAQTGTTSETAQNTDWNIGGKLDINWNPTQIISSILGKGGDSTQSTKNGTGIQLQVEGAYRSFAESKKVEELKTSKTQELEITTESEIASIGDGIDWHADIVTMDIDEYYNQFKEQIIRNPGSSKEVQPGTGKRILIDGAQVTLGSVPQVVTTRSNIVAVARYSGRVLGNLWQGFLASAGYDDLLSTTESVNPTSYISNRDNYSAFVPWLKEDGKNSVGKIFRSLQDLGFLGRVWDYDESRPAYTYQNGNQSDSYQPIEYVDDDTIRVLRSVPLDATLTILNHTFEQTYDSKPLNEYVIDRYERENNVKVGSNSSLIATDDAVGGTRSEYSQVAAGYEDRDLLHVLDTGFHHPGKGSNYVVVHSDSAQSASVNLGADTNADVIEFTSEGGKPSGCFVVSNFDPRRDVVIGDMFESLTWEVDDAHDSIIGHFGMESGLNRLDMLERARSGDAFMVTLYAPRGRLVERRRRSGKVKIIENLSKPYDLNEAASILSSNSAYILNSDHGRLSELGFDPLVGSVSSNIV